MEDQNEKASIFLKNLSEKLKDFHVKEDIDLGQPSQDSESALIRATRDHNNYKEASKILKKDFEMHQKEIEMKTINLVINESLKDLFQE